MWPLGPAAVELEQVTLGWLADLLDYPAGSGYFGSGATMANTVALAASRATGSASKHGVDVMQQGVRALPELAVYGSEELHLSDHKALRTLGLGSGCVARSRSTSATRCASTCWPRRSSATAPPASSRRS